MRDGFGEKRGPVQHQLHRSHALRMIGDQCGDSDAAGPQVQEIQVPHSCNAKWNGFVLSCRSCVTACTAVVAPNSANTL
jgi:hypothetical protein